MSYSSRVPTTLCSHVLHKVFGKHTWRYRHALYRQCTVCNERQALYAYRGQTFWCTRYPILKRQTVGVRVKPWFVIAQRFEPTERFILGIYRTESQAIRAAKHFVYDYTWGEAFISRKRTYKLVTGKLETAIYRERYLEKNS